MYLKEGTYHTSLFRPFKPAQVEHFKTGPVDIMVFADMLERCLKLATTITVVQYYCDNEELSMTYFLSIFTGDAASLAPTALDDTSPSDHAGGVCVGEAVAHFTTPTYGP